MQELGHCRGFGGRRRTAVIVSGQHFEFDFSVARDRPQEIRIELRGELVSLVQQRLRTRRGETKQHLVGLDLEAFARGRFDLQRGIVVGEDRAGLQCAVVLKKSVHDHWEFDECAIIACLARRPGWCAAGRPHTNARCGVTQCDATRCVIQNIDGIAPSG